jgi:hypothetical protein
MRHGKQSGPSRLSELPRADVPEGLILIALALARAAKARIRGERLKLLRDLELARRSAP